MKSEKKLFREFGLRISIAVFSAVGLATSGTALAALPVAPSTAANSVSTATQDAAYEQDVIPPQFDLYSIDQKTDRTKYSQRRQARSDFEKKVTDALASGGMSGSQKSEANNWIDRVILSEMTLNNPVVLTDLGKMRQDFFRRYISGASEANRKFVIEQIVVKKAADIAKKNYHPAARVNAVQILNWLDTKEGVSGTQLPEPSVAALQELYSIVNDKNSPDYLVAAAIAGIQRHAELDGQLPAQARMNASIRNAIVDAMLAQIAKYRNNRTDSDPGYLISRRAVQTLSGLNLAENDPKAASVKAAVQAAADDDQAGRWLRYDAMLALSKMPMTDPTSYVKQLGQLVALTGKEERKAMLAAKTMVEVEKEVSDKTSTASAKKKSSNAKSRRDSIASSGGGDSQGQSLGSPGDSRSGMGNMGGMGGMMGSYSEGDLLPYHLHYFRTNMKLATSIAQHILGTQDKASSGLKFNDTVRSNAELRQLINEIDNVLRRMQKATDIGLVEEKPMSRGEILRLSTEEQELIEQPSLIRVMGLTGIRIQELEKLVGKVEIEGEAEDDKSMKSMTVKTERSTADEADAAEDQGEGPELTTGSTTDEAESSTGDESGEETGDEG